MGEVGTSIPILDVLMSVYVWNLQEMEPCVQSKKNKKQLFQVNIWILIEGFMP